MAKLVWAVPVVLVAAGAGLLLRTPDALSAARSSKADTVQRMARDAGLQHPVRAIYIRAFKQERELEVWGADSKAGPYKLIHTYKVAEASGGLGPKRREGDRQVPEGFYHIDRFNPRSQFHLSLGLNYPNASDKILSDPDRPGSDIFIHGSNVSIGCLAMTDDKIEEIYLLASMGRANSPIPVHVFPARFDGNTLEKLSETHPEHKTFWTSLKPAYDSFERTRRVPSFQVLHDGSYRVR